MVKGLIIVQARMGSKRLPGKSLALMGGKPLLGHVIEALRSKFKEDIIIATSSQSDSDAIIEFAEKNEVEVFRGDENNVASRFLEISRSKSVTHLGRVSGDSPFIDCETIKKAFHVAMESNSDLVSTTGSAFPSGFNIEVFSSKIFQKNYPNFSTPQHFEHVTKFFYENENNFKICYLQCPVKDGRKYKFTVDTAEDKVRMDIFFSQLSRPPYTYSMEEKCEIYLELFGDKSC